MAAAAGVSPDVLRQWATAHGGIPEPLRFLGVTTPGGRRRYSVADAVLIRLVAGLGEWWGIGPARAIPAANAVADFIREIDERFAPHGTDALVKMAEVGPMAVLAPANWPARWTARSFPIREAYIAAKHLPPLGLHLDLAALFQSAAVAVTQAATSIIYGDEP
jgi:hypothetical protein